MYSGLIILLVIFGYSLIGVLCQQSSVEEFLDNQKKTCGNTSNGLKKLLFNGELKEPKIWPWIAAMYINGKFTCTANFISKTKAITSAHCFQQDPSPEDLSLKILSNITIDVFSYTIHPEYIEGLAYDIAILETYPVKSTAFVPVCLAKTRISVLHNLPGEVLTWALSNNRSNVALFGATMNMVNKISCLNIVNEMPDHAFCVTHEIDDSWLCNGESGGGFMIRDGSGRYYLRGIFGASLTDRDTCDPKSPLIFTDITKFLKFIVNSAEEIAPRQRSPKKDSSISKTCHSYTQFENLDGELQEIIEIPIQKSLENLEKITVHATFDSDEPIINDEQIPKFSLSTNELKSNEEVFEAVAEGKSVSFRININDEENSPKIKRIVVNNQTLCEEVAERSYEVGATYVVE